MKKRSSRGAVRRHHDVISLDWLGWVQRKLKMRNEHPSRTIVLLKWQTSVLLLYLVQTVQLIEVAKSVLTVCA